MEKNKTEVNVLDELNKGAYMGQDAIDFIIDKVTEEGLDTEYVLAKKTNNEISDKINNLYPEYSEKHPHETSTMNKMMTWYGIEMKTFNDQSTSKIAELLLQGTNMGIIEGRRLLNHKSSDENINRLVREYVDMQEQAVENLKQFL